MSLPENKRGAEQRQRSTALPGVVEQAGRCGGWRADQEPFCGLRIDRVPLPFDVHTRI
jgi:hypothetical protein